MIDYDALHELMWKNTDRHGTLLLKQTQVAEGLGFTRQRANAVFGNMVKDGRLERKGRKYHVIPPDEWKWGKGRGEVPWKSPLK